jgi:hypothetical protein
MYQMEEKMKKLLRSEMKAINGGHRYQTDCTGWNFDYRTWHNIPIVGSHSDQKAAVKLHNKALKEHKENTYFKNFYHSAKELKL